jgi:L-iditol 2-dehydrogenase
MGRQVPSSMRAARIVGRGHLACDEAPVPAPVEGAVLVRTLVASICGSDFHVVDLAYYARGRPSTIPGPPGFPGPESIVEVVDAPGGEVAPGQLALAVPPAHASAAFAEYQVVAPSALVPLPTTDAWDQLVLAQQLGTVSYAFDTFSPGSVAACTVAIVGAGSAGILFAREARRRGAATTLVTDPSEARLDAAKRAGADVTVPAGDGAFSEAVLDVTGGRGAELVIDATGRDSGRATATAVLAKDATLGMFGLPMRTGESPFDLARIFEQRARLIAAHSAQLEPGLRSFRSAVDRVAAGELEDLGLLTHRFALDDVDDAFAAARARDAALKVLLEVGDPS